MPPASAPDPSLPRRWRRPRSGLGDPPPRATRSAAVQSLAPRSARSGPPFQSGRRPTAEVNMRARSVRSRSDLRLARRELVDFAAWPIPSHFHCRRYCREEAAWQPRYSRDFHPALDRSQKKRPAAAPSPLTSPESAPLHPKKSCGPGSAGSSPEPA